MHNDSKAILDDILSRWHHHCKTYQVVRQSGADPMFRNAKSPNHWDSTADIADDSGNSAQMKAVDFAVSEMQDPHRAAIYVNARNCYTGRSVWLSPRLPTDPAARALVIGEARSMLMRRLIAAGVM